MLESNDPKIVEFKNRYYVKKGSKRELYALLIACLLNESVH